MPHHESVIPIITNILGSFGAKLSFSGTQLKAASIDRNQALRHDVTLGAVFMLFTPAEEFSRQNSSTTEAVLLQKDQAIQIVLCDLHCCPSRDKVPTFGPTPHPSLATPTSLTKIQYNGKYRDFLLKHEALFSMTLRGIHITKKYNPCAFERNDDFDSQCN